MSTKDLPMTPLERELEQQLNAYGFTFSREDRQSILAGNAVEESSFPANREKDAFVLSILSDDYEHEHSDDVTWLVRRCTAKKNDVRVTYLLYIPGGKEELDKANPAELDKLIEHALQKPNDIGEIVCVEKHTRPALLQGMSPYSPVLHLGVSGQDVTWGIGDNEGMKMAYEPKKITQMVIDAIRKQEQNPEAPYDA